jgi:hypothetical protein
VVAGSGVVPHLSLTQVIPEKLALSNHASFGRLMAVKDQSRHVR